MSTKILPYITIIEKNTKARWVFGKLLKLTTFGESHGEALGGIIDGCPAGIELDLNAIEMPGPDFLFFVFCQEKTLRIAKTIVFHEFL